MLIPFHPEMPCSAISQQVAGSATPSELHSRSQHTGISSGPKQAVERKRKDHTGNRSVLGRSLDGEGPKGLKWQARARTKNRIGEQARLPPRQSSAAAPTTCKHAAVRAMDQARGLCVPRRGELHVPQGADRRSPPPVPRAHDITLTVPAAQATPGSLGKPGGARGGARRSSGPRPASPFPPAARPGPRCAQPRGVK